MHISAVHGERRPLVGDRVLFVAGRDAQGRLRAEHVRLDAPLTLDQPAIRQRPARSHSTGKRESGRGRPSRRLIVGNVSSSAQAGAVRPALSATAAGQPASAGLGVAAGAHAVASLLTFFLYWRDKHSALKDRWRTPETTLHLFELAGGWPGALLAQQVFRHKTRKLGYQLLFWLIVVLHQAFWIDLLFIGSGFTRERTDWLLRLF